MREWVEVYFEPREDAKHEGSKALEFDFIGEFQVASEVDMHIRKVDARIVNETLFCDSTPSERKTRVRSG